MTKEEAAVKALAEASRKMLDAFVSSPEGQQWMGDCFAGFGVSRVSPDGSIHRVAPEDFRPLDEGMGEGK